MDIDRALRIIEGCMLIKGHYDSRKEAVDTIRAALAEVQKPADNSQSDAMLSLRDCVELISILTKCDDGSLLPPIERGKFNRAKDVIAHAHV